MALFGMRNRIPAAVAAAAAGTFAVGLGGGADSGKERSHCFFGPFNSAPPPRKYLIGGNWKCNNSVEEVKTLVKGLNESGPIPAHVEVAVGVPAVHIPIVLDGLRKDFNVSGQDCGVSGLGAFTGETAAEMLTDVGCTWVILGHSERRQYQGESSALIAAKAAKAISCGLSALVCVGETLDEREAGRVDAVVLDDHMAALLATLKEADWAHCAIAYEPVWAIGTGKTASPEQAQEVHASIRAWIAKHVSADVAAKTRILYGGSMKGANAAGLLSKPDIDGGLIGGASLKAGEFVNGICGACPTPSK